MEQDMVNGNKASMPQNGIFRLTLSFPYSDIFTAEAWA
jgi:hypothetical protein